MESEPRFDPTVWRRLGSELGVLGMSVPEADGGVGGSLVDQAVAVEEFGATLACGPLFGTVYLAIPALVACPAGPDRDELLAALVEGERTAAFAITDRAGAFDPAALTVTADDGTLTGTVERVVDADAADELLVAAIGSDGVGLYAVDSAGPGVQRTGLLTMDLTRPQATVVLDRAPARLLAGPAEAERVITHALQVGATLLAVEQVGAAQHLLDLSVDYAKSRLQFGRQIGSFQAIKHKLADMLVDLEHARSAAYHAAWALSDGSDDPALAASIAQALSSAALQTDCRRHDPGARRYRVHLGTPGAPVLQACRHRRRPAGQRRAAPRAGRRSRAGQRRRTQRRGESGHRTGVNPPGGGPRAASVSQTSRWRKHG